MKSDSFGFQKPEELISFPLYAASRELIRRYSALLDGIGLTYTQYLSMSLLWDRGVLTSKEMGDMLRLDSGTLTPLLKKLEAKGLIERRRLPRDERNLEISITDMGMELKDKAADIPGAVASTLNISNDDCIALRRILSRMISFTES